MNSTLKSGTAYRFNARLGKLFESSGNPVVVRRQSLEVLGVLVEREGDNVAKSELLEVVWPRKTASEDSLVKAVGDLRKSLKDQAHDIIQTIPTKGYRLQPGALIIDDGSEGLIRATPLTKLSELTPQVQKSQSTVRRQHSQQQQLVRKSVAIGGFVVLLGLLSLVALRFLG